MPERIHSNRRLALPSPGAFLPMSTSLFGRLPFGENGDRQGIIQNNPVTRISGRKLQRKRPPTNQLRFQGKRCRYDFPFPCPTKGASHSKGGREVAAFCPELADNYTRPMGSSDRTGLQNRTVKPSSANQPPFPPSTVSITDFPSAGRNIKSPSKRSDHRSYFQSLGGILQQPFSCGEEGRVRATPSNQPFQVQQLCGILPLQDGRLKSSCRPIETRGFHVQTRPERRLFLGPLHRRSQKFIRFLLQGRTYQFTCLPFGLTSAPRIFTKILKPVTGILTKMGIRIIVYLDDMLIMNSTLEGSRKYIMILKSILENLGFRINMEKSIFVPVQIIEILGIILDSTTMRFLLPDEKVAVIQKECHHLVSSQVTS